jgi:Na+/melibiose symporter-like transporter
MLGYGGAVFCLLLPLILSAFGSGDEVSVVHAMGWTVIVVAPLTSIIAVAFVGEPSIARSKEQKIAPRDYLALARRPAMLRLLSANLLLSVAPSLTGALYFFFFHEARGYSFQDATVLLLIYIAAGLLMPVWARIAKLIGKHRALMAATFVNAFGQCFLLILPHDVQFMAAAMFIAGFAANSYGLLTNAMVADVSDEVRLQTGQDRTAPLFALMIVFAKIGAAIPLAITFPILKAVGFNAAQGAVNTPAAIHGLEMCFVTAPVLAIALGGLSLWGYHLSADAHGEIRRKLEESDARALASGLSSEGILNPATRIPSPVELDAAP